MSHVRTQIRSAVQTTLHGSTLADTRVYAARRTPLPEDDYPAILIYTPRELADAEMGEDREYVRRLTINIDVLSEALDDLDDKVDAVAVQVETLLAANRTLGGVCMDLWLTETEIGEPREGENHHGIARLTYVADYTVAETDPETAL